jgi:hypothetical protein
MGGNVTIHGVDDTNERTLGGKKWIPVKVDPNGNLKISSGTYFGQEQPDSEFNSLTRVTPDSKIFRYAFGSGDTTVYSGPCRLLGVLVNVAFAGGGITLDDGDSNAILDLPTGVLTLAANLVLPGLRFETSMTLDHDFGGTTSAGECFIFYREGLLA